MSSDREVFLSTLEAAIAPWKLGLDASSLAKMADHFAAMVEANKSFNLTRITDPIDAAVKHYADSLAPLAWARAERIAVDSVLDIGTGAGFPAVPLAIARPDWQVTAIDGTKKKVNFVARSAAALGLNNLNAVHAHSDHWDTPKRFGIVTARAVGSVTDCMKAAIHFVARSGWIVLFRTPETSEKECAEACARVKGSGELSISAFGYSLVLRSETLERSLLVGHSRK